MLKPAICLLLLAALSVARGEDSTKDAKIDELLTLMNVNQAQKQIMEQMKNMVRAQVAAQLGKTGAPANQLASADEVQKRIFDLMTERLSWDKMKPAYRKAYSDTFSEPEIDGILAFYRSPAGRAMIDKMPTLMAKTVSITQEQVGSIIPEIDRIVHEVSEKYKSAPANEPPPQSKPAK